MSLGNQILSMDHITKWSLINKRQIVIVSKDGESETVHGWRFVGNTPARGLYNLLRKGRVYEYRD